MKNPNTPHAASPNELVPFLSRTLPFSELEPETLERLARECSIDFAPKGTSIFSRGETMVDALYLIQKGGVRLSLPQEQGDDRLIDYRGEGGAFGALALIRDSPANLDVETIEDSFFFKVPKHAFLDLFRSRPLMSQYYLKTFSENYVSKAFAELRQQQADLCVNTGLYLFSTRLEDMVKRPPEIVASGTSLRAAAGVMVDKGIGSLLVRDPRGGISGIVTDKDLRRAVAEGEAFDSPIEFVMSSPVATAGHHEVCFDGLLKMMAAKIHHLAVVRQGEVLGMVTSHDIMVLQGRSPISLFRDITKQRSIQGLYDISNRVPLVVGNLIEEGAKAGNITRMITVMNDLILEKMLAMLQDQMGPPPAPWCWILMGSEGRREQTFRTDQDNALVYADPADGERAKACEAYFAKFSERAIEHLVKCGYPLCPGGMMASNPKWRMPFSAFRDRFERMILQPEPEEVLNATIFFDFRPGYGSRDMGEALRSHVARHAKRQDVFLRYLARDCLATKPPLSFFRNFIVEKNGEHKNTLDVKTRGLTPFVDFARVLALRHGVRETNTLDRLRLLGEGGFLSLDLVTQAMEAYEFLMQVRLVHQMACIDQGREPDNRVNPAELTDLEKKTLKEAFAVISSLQSHIKELFSLNVG